MPFLRGLLNLQVRQILRMAQINKDMLSQDVIADQCPYWTKPLICGSHRQVGSEWIRRKWYRSWKYCLLSYGQSAPAGYSLYQRGEPKELVWEEKAPVSVARWLMMEWKFWMVRFILWEDTMVSAKNIAERYDPTTNLGNQ